jgi:hypothetical protein
MLGWIRNIITEVLAIAFLGFNKAEKAALERGAESIRELAAEWDSKARPLILNEPETCPKCTRRRMLFVWPYKVCDTCYSKALNRAFDVAHIAELSFWSELVTLTETYQDGMLSSEHALTINLKNVGPEDGKRLSKIENPAEAIERQINILISRNNLADKLKVLRDNYLVHIYSTS